jgi:hypothetical protein
VDNWKNLTNQNSVRKKRSFGGTFSFSNCHIKGLDNDSLVLIVFGTQVMLNKAKLLCIYCGNCSKACLWRDSEHSTHAPPWPLTADFWQGAFVFAK